MGKLTKLVNPFNLYVPSILIFLFSIGYNIKSSYDYKKLSIIEQQNPAVIRNYNKTQRGTLNGMSLGMVVAIGGGLLCIPYLKRKDQEPKHL